MRHLDLFSGIGGFALAAKWTWGDEYENIGHSEIEKFPCKVYHKHFPESECLGDITKIDWGRFAGRVDLLTGGFPCQPFSTAGKRKGKEDDRWLWHEMFRAIRETEPRWIIGENVAGIVNVALDQVLSELEGNEYATETFAIPACALNAPHRRDRIWIVAHNSELSGHWQHEPSSTKPNSNGQKDRLSEPTNSNATNTHARRFIGQEISIRRGKPQQEDFMLARNDWWDESWYEVATEFCRMDDGVPLELDFIGGLDDYFIGKKSESEIRELEWKILREMWKQKELATTSPNLYTERLYHLVPEMPHQRTSKRWNLGAWQQSEPDLCDLWERFSTKGFPSEKGLRERLLERIGKAKCEQTVAHRVDRLKGLGNAIVPQVAQVIMEAIKLSDAQQSKLEFTNKS